MHGFPDRDTVVEKLGHVGHHAIIHGAIVRRNSMIGMGAILLDYCEIAADSIVAAQALVKANEIVPPRSMMAGIPAKRIRGVTDKDLEWKRLATTDYKRLPPLYHKSLKPADPLTIALSMAGIGAIAALSGYLPARRATTVDPLRALRWE